MKRILSIVLTLVMICSFAACGNEQAAKTENEISKLYADGFACIATTADEEMWRGLFQKDGSYDVLYKVTASMSKELYEQFDSLDWEDEEGHKQFYCSLENVTVENIASIVPSEEDLKTYAGMKFGELDDLGWYNSGWTGGEGEAYTFYYDGPVFYCSIVPEETVTNVDDLSPNDMRELTVKEMSFMGISSAVLEQ